MGDRRPLGSYGIWDSKAGALLIDCFDNPHDWVRVDDAERYLKLHVQRDHLSVCEIEWVPLEGSGVKAQRKPCSECLDRSRLLREAEELLAEKRSAWESRLAEERFQRTGILEWRAIPDHSRARLLGIAERAVAQARANLEHHQREHEEKP